MVTTIITAFLVFSLNLMKMDTLIVGFIDFKWNNAKFKNSYYPLWGSLIKSLLKPETPTVTSYSPPKKK